MSYVVIYYTEEEKEQILATVKKNNDDRGETIALFSDTGLSTRPAYETTDHTPPVPIGSLSFLGGGSFLLLNKELVGKGFITMHLGH